MEQKRNGIQFVVTKVNHSADADVVVEEITKPNKGQNLGVMHMPALTAFCSMSS